MIPFLCYISPRALIQVTQKRATIESLETYDITHGFTNFKTYTINNIHTSSTNSKHDILQFDLAKKCLKIPTIFFFFTYKEEEAIKCFHFSIGQT